MRDLLDASHWELFGYGVLALFAGAAVIGRLRIGWHMGWEWYGINLANPLANGGGVRRSYGDKCTKSTSQLKPTLTRITIEVSGGNLLSMQ